MRVLLLAFLLAFGLNTQDSIGFQDTNPFGDGNDAVSASVDAVASQPKQDPADDVFIEFAANSFQDENGMSATGQNNRRTLASLRRIVSMKFTEMEFRIVREKLMQKLGHPIILDISAQDDSLTDDELVSVDIKNARMSTAIRLMLLEQNATYMIDDGVIRIISLDVQSDPEFFRRHAFDCRSLLSLNKKNEVAFPSEGGGLSQFYNMPGGFGGASGNGGVFNTQTAGPQGGSVGGGFSGSGGSVGGGLGAGGTPQGLPGGGFGGGGRAAQTKRGGGGFGGGNQSTENGGGGVSQPPQKPEPTPESQKLIDLIKMSVNPDGWDDTNGDGTVMAIGGVLVVSNDEKTLQEIGDLLADLEHLYSSGKATAHGLDTGEGKDSGHGLDTGEGDGELEFYPSTDATLVPGRENPKPKSINSTRGGVNLEIEK